MKTALRKLLCGCLAVLMVLGTAVPGLAATYDVGSAQDLSVSWHEANNNSSASNTFYMTNNIDMTGYGLDAMDNKSYTIQSKGNTDYSLSNVMIYEGTGTVSGKDPQVSIQVDVTDNNKKDSNAALSVYGDVSVVVDGDITVKADAGQQTHAVVAANDASLIVMGDITSKDAGVLAIDSTVTVYGDVKVNGSKVVENSPDFAVAADDNAKVTINGDVDSTKGGANVTDGAGVLIKGDLSSDKEALHVVNGSALQVTGDVEVPGEVWVTDRSTLTVESDLDTQSELMVQNHSTMNVTGHVDAVGQSNIYNQSKLVVSNGTRQAGLTIEADPSLPENMPSGIFVSEKSKLEVYGDTIVPGMFVIDGSRAELDDLQADELGVGTGGPKDASVFYSDDITGVGGGTTHIYTAGKADVEIQGHAKGSLTACDDSRVDIYGNLDHVPLVLDNAIVNTNVAYKKPITFYENMDSQAEDNLVKLCKGYTENSAMKSHMDCLEDIMINVSVDLTKKMGIGNALVISVFQGDEIAMSLIPEFNYDTLKDSGYNSGSIANLKDAKSVNSYEVSMYKAAIAESLKALDESVYQTVNKEENEKKLKLSKAFYSLIDNKANDLPKDQVDFLNKALKNDIFSEDEAREFLIKFQGYKAGQKGIGAATKELVALYDAAKVLNGLNKAGKIAMTAEKFKEFFANSYTNQVKVLDNMLMNQEMSPEMFIAVAQLRNEFDDKFLGALGIGQDVAKDLLADKIKDCIAKKIPVYGMVDAVMDIAEVLGATDKADAVHKAAPIICYLPQAMNAYESSINRVKNGDTSPEALELVNMNYTFVRESLKALCKYMTIAGDKTQKEDYAKLAQQLDKLEIGHAIGQVETIMMSGEFDQFYRNSIDPNVQYRYA